MLILRGESSLGSTIFDEVQLQGNALLAERDALQAENARLQAELDERRTPPPTAKGLLGWNNPDARLGARRMFYQWKHLSTMAAKVKAVADAGQYPLVSQKPPNFAGGWPAVAAGQYDSSYRTLLNSLPPCDFSFHPEPEEEGSASVFTAAFDRVSGLMPPHVRPVVCLMDWTFDPASGRTWQNWLPDTAKSIAIDPYNWFRVKDPTKGGVWKWPGQLMMPVLQKLRDSGDARPVSVWETQSAEDPADIGRKASWLHEFAALAEGEELEQLVFWDSLDTQPQYALFKLFSSPQAADAVTEIVARPYFKRDGA